jgi:hypothetical protein
MKLTDEQIVALQQHDDDWRKGQGTDYYRIETIHALATEVIESRAEIERLREALALASAVVDGSIRKVERLEARVAKLEEALAHARAWHESEAKALSKSGRSDADYHWRRCGHADQIAHIRQVLPDAEYHTALDRNNARAALGMDET